MKSILIILAIIGFPFCVSAQNTIKRQVNQQTTETKKVVTSKQTYKHSTSSSNSSTKSSADSSSDSITYSRAPYFSNGELYINGVTYNMVLVQAGSFTMGATPEMQDEAAEESFYYEDGQLLNNEFSLLITDERPTHRVTLTNSYYIGETEVTQELWTAVMEYNPSQFQAAKSPVESVSWNECMTFISKLNSLTGRQFRLPTEAEWEFAARGGNRSRGSKYSGSNNSYSVAWSSNNSNTSTHNVKMMQSNELGIYDMSGNVFEWCSDCFSRYSNSSQTNPTGASSGSNRVIRGGSFAGDAFFCRASCRTSMSQDSRGNGLGLRLALTE